MVFATGSPVGDRITHHLYGQAASEFPEKREEAIRLRAKIADEEAGLQTLFEIDARQSASRNNDHLYEYVPPLPPFGSPERTSLV